MPSSWHHVLNSRSPQIRFFLRGRGRGQPGEPRPPAFFVTFHTAFYEGLDRLTFAKGQIDLLKKDAQHRLADPGFELSLEVAARSHTRQYTCAHTLAHTITHTITHTDTRTHQHTPTHSHTRKH
jgi:hypothetical protein